MTQNAIQIGNWLISESLVTALLPLVGVLVGGLLTYLTTHSMKKRQEKRDQAVRREERELRFLNRQLDELYAPMVSCLKDIKAKSELRHQISKASDSAWREICARHPKPFEDHERYFAPFRKTIEYDNKQLREVLMPMYERMLSIFTDNYWLAKPSTRTHYPELSRFVDLWQRWLQESIPSEVVRKMDHTESRLIPLYQDLEHQLEELKEEIAGG